MSATATTTPSPQIRSGSVAARVRGGLLAVWAAITGAAPHVLHHVGPLAGSALVAGAGGRAAFGAVGFVATIPTLRRLRRRTGSWRTPALALLAFATIFTLSTLVIGPASATPTPPRARSSLLTASTTTATTCPGAADRDTARGDPPSAASNPQPVGCCGLTAS